MIYGVSSSGWLINLGKLLYEIALTVFSKGRCKRDTPYHDVSQNMRYTQYLKSNFDC